MSLLKLSTTSRYELTASHSPSSLQPSHLHTRYILQLASLSSQIPLGWACSTSDADDGIELLQFSPDSSSFRLNGVLKPSKDGRGRVTQLRWCSGRAGSSGVLLAGFAQRSVLACWDLRLAPGEPIMELRGTTSAPFLSCDLSLDGTIIAGGSSDDDGAQVEIYDLRGNTKRPMCIYDQSHSDLITAVAFHPSSSDRLLSASTDGLLVTYDTRLSDEDEAVVSTGNVGASVAHARWEADGRTIWAGTDMATLSAWKSDDFTLLKDYGDLRQDSLAKPDPGWQESVSYLIDCVDPSSIAPSSRSGYFAGSQIGEVMLVDTTDTGEEPWQVLASLKGGHEDIVRCAAVDDRDGLIATGGEDGRVCLWSNGRIHEPSECELESNTSSVGKSELNLTKEKRYKPY